METNLINKYIMWHWKVSINIVRYMT